MSSCAGEVEKAERERSRAGGAMLGNWLNGLLYGLGGLACTCVVLLVTFQEKLVYVPVIPGMSKGYPITPARLNLKYEDVWLESSDGVRLHSWFIKAQPGTRGEFVCPLP